MYIPEETYSQQKIMVIVELVQQRGHENDMGSEHLSYKEEAEKAAIV